MPFVIDLTKLRWTQDAYVNAKGNTECALIVQLSALVDPTRPVPKTVQWRAGLRVKGAPAGSIVPGTAIATFTAAGTYPTEAEDHNHAAVYLGHDALCIRVIDQWKQTKRTPARRPLPFTGGGRNSNTGDHFYVIESTYTLAHAAIEAAHAATVARNQELLRQGEVDAANRSIAYVAHLEARMAANRAVAAILWWKRGLAQ